MGFDANRNRNGACKVSSTVFGSETHEVKAHKRKAKRHASTETRERSPVKRSPVKRETTPAVTETSMITDKPTEASQGEKKEDGEESSGFQVRLEDINMKDVQGYRKLQAHLQKKD